MPYQMHYPWWWYNRPGSPGWHPPGDTQKFIERREEDAPLNPDPVPWSVAFLVSAVSSKAAAANMTNKTAAAQIMAAADQAIAVRTTEAGSQAQNRAVV